MDQLAAYVSLGIRHILGLGGIDHVLFLLALAAGYRLRDWRHGVWVVSAFTIGHSLTLALSAVDLLRVPTELVEFLIPVTIVAAGAETLAGARPPSGWRRPLLAGLFGLVHGAGFANYLRGLFDEAIVVPLLGFNVGIEMAQIVVLLTAGIVLACVDHALATLAWRWSAISAFRVRAIGVSAAISLAAAVMAASRAPWR